MKQKFQCEVCKNYHDTPKAANECEREHLLPVEVLAARYDAGAQGPSYVQVKFDNKQGGEYAATYKFVCWRDPEEVIPSDYQANIEELVTAQLRNENSNLKSEIEGLQNLMNTLNDVIKKQAAEIDELKKLQKALTPADSGYHF